MDYLSDLRRELGLTDPRKDREQEEKMASRRTEQQASGDAASSRKTRGKMTAVEKAKERAAERNQAVMNRLGSYGFMPAEAQRATQLGKGLDSIHLASVRDLSNQIASLKVEQLGRIMDEDD